MTESAEGTEGAYVHGKYVGIGGQDEGCLPEVRSKR